MDEQIQGAQAPRKVNAALLDILRRNEGSRLSPELIAGLYTSIARLVEGGADGD